MCVCVCVCFFRRKRKPSLRGSQHSEDGHSDLLEKSRSLADAVKRRRFLFQHGSHDVSHDQPGPSWSSEGGSRKCPVCDEALATDEESASRHVSQCLQSQVCIYHRNILCGSHDIM